MSEIGSDRWLSEVKIERFKAAFKPKPIALARFNVVIGRNGSGKSTLLEALQWLDTTVRTTARDACSRYFGMRDLINLRTQAEVGYFRLHLLWRNGHPEANDLQYKIKVEDHQGEPRIVEESLASLSKTARKKILIDSDQAGLRELHLNGSANAAISIPFHDKDRLALSWASSSDPASPGLGFLRQFWDRAVFLRLSPNRLAAGSLATRKSTDPLLDEEGQTLPALLKELSSEQREELVELVREVLPGIRNVEVSTADFGRDTRVNYSLHERMPYRGRAGRSQFAIPSWMLSEGTRRITAILALLVRDPPPSLLCIEEIENGLDPWTIRKVLDHLRSAAERGTQVVVTSHSPWLLDHVPLESILLVRRKGGDTQYEHFESVPEVASFDPSIPAGTRYTHLTENEP